MKFYLLFFCSLIVSVYSGTGSLGTSCTRHSDCNQAFYYCHGVSYTGSPGSCRHLKSPGGYCNHAYECEKRICDTANHVCAHDRAQLDTHCNMIWDLEPYYLQCDRLLYCSRTSRTCKRKLPPGSDCTFDAECTTKCGLSKKCVEEEYACSIYESRSHCPEGHFCYHGGSRYISYYLCIPKYPDGELCSSDGECQSNKCRRRVFRNIFRKKCVSNE